LVLHWLCPVQVQAATGATFIPPYNHPSIIAGQGTIALEFLEQVGGGATIVLQSCWRRT